MNRGALIFAHNNRDVDYILLSLISGSLVKKNLEIPVTLVTDRSSLAWADQSGISKKISEVFDKIIEVDKPITDNTRNLYDGINSKLIPFTNTNRSSAWSLTPYDRTLLIDSDYLIFSKNLNNYWEVEESILISESLNDIFDKKRVGYHDKYISDTAPHLYWATTVMFTKNEESRIFFELVEFIKSNYQYYADLFRFNSTQFRNDIAFSVAKHILSGFTVDSSTNLPPILTVQDKDILYDVKKDRSLIFLIQTDFNSNYALARSKDLDVHIMNKQSIIRNKEKFLSIL